MKRQFFTLFLSLLLSGCGGGGGGSSSSGGSSSKKPQSCAIANGSGHKVWDKTAKKYSTTCTLVTCNAGFDNDEDSTQCQTTAANYYSPANDKTRTACPTTPHSSATTTTGLSSAKGCYNCDGGYLKNTASNTCEVPSKGKYVNASGNEQSCSDPGGTVGGFETFLNNTEGVSNATGCNFSCKSGFVKNTATFTCNIPDTGKYADSSGDEQSCNAITRDLGGFNTFLANMIAVNSAAGCGFTCNTGFLKSGRACNFPRKGKYVDGSGSEENCDNVGGTPGGFHEFSNNGKGVSSATGCNFSCKQNHVKSASDYTCTRGQTCPITNGAGFQQTSSDTCEVVDCNAGYDSTQAPTTQCQQTVSGFFSLADDKTRTTCPTPQNSSPTSTTSLSSADGCYTCNGGYLKNTASNACAFPSKGTYVNVGGTEVSCNPITLQGTATSAWIAGAAATAITCPFSCSAGFVKSGRACNTPDTGKYADNVGVEQSCDGPTGATGGFKEFLPNTGAVSTAAGCGFSCKSGFVKNTANRTCNIPDIGKYADSSGDEQSCNNPTGATGGFKEFLANTAAVATATGCSFSCNAGFVKNTADSMCEIPDQGKYADNAGGEQGCSSITGAATGFKTFLPNTVAVSTPTGCGFSCNTGYMKDSSARECNYPTPGTYVNNQGAESSCTDITRMTGFGSWVSGAATADDACPFSCSPGFVKSGKTCNIPHKGKYADNGVEKACSPITGGGFNTFLPNTAAVSTATGCGFFCNSGFVKSGRTCNIPDQGKYADGAGDEQSCDTPTGATGGFNTFLANTAAVSSAAGCNFSCNAGFMKIGSKCNYPTPGSYVNNQGNEALCNPNSITTEGTATSPWIAGAAESATTCPFSCSAGYLKDSSARECKYPTLGHYADAQGAEVGCTDITSITGFGSWLEGAATDADSCPFLCASGYTISGRTCNKAIPQTLALGTDTSHVLFDNGEVEAWGKVSASPWRSHIKEDLGSHTAQALASGDYHQCIILKNAALNHGRLMCWGQNGDNQLGVGDTNPRSTLTPVTASILGDAGGGVPNTVKSVALGGEHTCALLNDDTVVCWGGNVVGQIGGGSGFGSTIIGLAGDPLNGRTASRIATGAAHTCAVLTTDNSVQCWGNNADGQTSGGTPSLGAGKTAIEIATGAASSCATLNDASVVCWGWLSAPNLESKTATKITVGTQHGCALLSDKTVKCWGSNTEGQIGGGASGSGRVLRGTSGDPLGGETAIAIATSPYHSCAIMKSGNSVKCWGKNINVDDTGFYGQIVGGVAMTGGTNGTGTSSGESQTLTANSTPTAIALEEDAGGKICKITLSGGGLSYSWILKDYSTPLTYNTGGSTAISDAIDNLIEAIGSPVKLAGTDVTLTKTGGNKITATVNNAVFNGMTLTIYHDDNGGDCTTSPVGTLVTLSSGGSGGDKAEGLWVISNAFTGTGDKTVNLDSIHIDLGNSPLTTGAIADKVITEVNGVGWAGKQNVDLPYMATKLDGGHDTGDDCPDTAFCVVFDRVFKGTEGNYGIPFGDRDYEH